MADYIDRQAAIDAMAELEEEAKWHNEAYSDWKGYIDGIHDANDAIKTLPSADVQHWIPCSERLPEEDGEYLVTDVSGGAATVTETYFITDCEGEGHWGALDVIAWMPLPEPYNPIDGAMNPPEVETDDGARATYKRDL